MRPKNLPRRCQLPTTGPRNRTDLNNRNYRQIAELSERFAALFAETHRSIMNGLADDRLGIQFSEVAMGIKFHCPNGHKLNVKAFLAGKKAVCPKCGEKVLVPEQSESAVTDAPESPVVDASAADPQPETIAAPVIVTSKPAAAAPQPTQPAVAQKPIVQPAAQQPAIVTQPAVAPLSGQPSPGTVDAIAEAPTAVWYVRPPSGGQFGPAAGDIMRGWLAEGRVTADSLVWWAAGPTGVPRRRPFRSCRPVRCRAHRRSPVHPRSEDRRRPHPFRWCRALSVMVVPGGQAGSVLPTGVPMGQVASARFR